MKKSLFVVAALATMSLSASAQRMTLHEEFTGENCPPCASTNPAFWALCDGAGNPSKLIHISYMVPIPSAGFYCNRTTAIYTARDAYYSVPFAPYGRYDGHVPNPTASSPGHPGFFTQADIDAEAAVPDSFTMSISSTWNSNFDSIISTVTITCVTAWNGTTPYLRTALIHTDEFATPPGTNGETDFSNVVQAMYPSALGTSMPAMWTAGMTQTFTIAGAVPSWLDKSDAPYMVAWIQDDANKVISQAAKATPLAPPTNDAAITAVSGPGNLICNANGPYTLAHTVTLKNTGSSLLTAATIYYSVDGAAMLSYAWTGSLATGATASVTMPSASITITGALYHSVYDSVANPNGSTDKNLINNNGGKSIFIESTNALALPYATSFETVDNGKFDFIDANANGNAWGIYNSTTALGHTGANAAMFDCFAFAAGETEVMTLPMVATGGPAKLTFYTSHAAYTASTPEDDKLEVVYSTDCGSNWTSIWSKSGTALINQPVSTSAYVPTATKYVAQSQVLNAVPANAILGFRGTSAFGNNIWVDDVNVVSTVGVQQVNSSAASINIYPNPAKETATVSFTLDNATEVAITVIDQLGRTVVSLPATNMNAGVQSVSVATGTLPSGLYSVVVKAGEERTTLKLTVAK